MEKLFACQQSRLSNMKHTFDTKTLPFCQMLYFILLQGCGDEVCLRQIVYDAVLTVEYSFPAPQREVQLPCKSLKNFAVRWLLVLDNALQSARYGNAKIVAAVKQL